jgi:hypothetical protein
LVVELSALLGSTVGRLRAAQSKRQRWIFALVRFLNLE